MTDGAILDYASPRKRSALRLPATSRLAVRADDGRFTVEESLSGQVAALAALLFGAFVLFVITFPVIDGVYDLHRHRIRNDFTQAYIFGVLWLAEAATMVGVLQQTWRRTVLAVEYDEVRLAFLSPLRRRRYRWSGSDIADVFIVQTAETDRRVPLGEVVLTRAVGGEVRLFTDHPAERLGPIAVGVHAMLREGSAGRRD